MIADILKQGLMIVPLMGKYVLMERVFLLPLLLSPLHLLPQMHRQIARLPHSLFPLRQHRLTNLMTLHAVKGVYLVATTLMEQIPIRLERHIKQRTVVVAVDLQNLQVRLTLPRVVYPHVQVVKRRAQQDRKVVVVLVLVDLDPAQVQVLQARQAGLEREVPGQLVHLVDREQGDLELVTMEEAQALVGLPHHQTLAAISVVARVRSEVLQLLHPQLLLPLHPLQLPQHLLRLIQSRGLLYRSSSRGRGDSDNQSLVPFLPTTCRRDLQGARVLFQSLWIPMQ